MFAVARQQPNRPKEWLTAWGTWTVNPTCACAFGVKDQGGQSPEGIALESAPRLAVTAKVAA